MDLKKGMQILETRTNQEFLKDLGRGFETLSHNPAHFLFTLTKFTEQQLRIANEEAIFAIKIEDEGEFKNYSSPLNYLDKNPELLAEELAQNIHSNLIALSNAANEAQQIIIENRKTLESHFSLIVDELKKETAFKSDEIDRVKEAFLDRLMTEISKKTYGELSEKMKNQGIDKKLEKVYNKLSFFKVLAKLG